MDCPTCDHENRDGAKFCEECASPLAAARPRAEERKVVTILFCDLVGFTAASEIADPEDVRARLRPYHELLRAEIQRYGGTVEKFIGDAVMAVFGAPTAHEDDPERAVRSGLRILDAIVDLNVEQAGLELHVRIGINTGEGIVAIHARPELGEGMVTGDVVNTASRLQGVAPVDGVAVGEATYEATRHTFEYEELPPAELKGKAEPVRLFHAKAARARFGSELLRQHATPLVGREIDLAILRGAFDKVVAGPSVQLVTIVGEPGVGKSRLVAELDAYIDSLPDLLVRVRKGRCLPYGEGITFWALGEIVKWEAGILESDAPETAASKIDRVVPDEASDAPWLRQRLRPLVGLEAPSASREENFAGWRRFLELLAEDGPTIAVFEDLHWADEALLAFIEHVADFAQGVPLLLVGTARPELHERAEGWGGHLRNSITINLAPLSEQDTAKLVANLLEQAVLPAEVQRAILERAGGNPLYAEEFVRLLKDRGVLTQETGTWQLDPAAEIPMPSGVQGLISARLDTLDSEQKALLQDAAVVGKVFWSGMLAEIGGRERDVVERDLHELSRRELVRAVRRSSVEGEHEYAFLHALMRDVAYGQIPRAARGSKHVAAARWIERLAGDRTEDHAEILAAHYGTALELATASDSPDAEALRADAVRYLALAGDRALGLDVEASERSYRRALDLIDPVDPERPKLLVRHAGSLLLRARFAEAAVEFEEGIGGLRTQGDERAAAVAMNTYTLVLARLGDPRDRVMIAEALAILEPGGPSAELVAALAEEAGALVIRETRPEAAIAVADQAIEMASSLGLPEPARALHFRGISKSGRGDRAGLDDLRRAIDLAKGQGLGREVDLLHYNLAEMEGFFEGPRARLEILRDGLALAVGRGDAELALGFRQSMVLATADLGAWDEALRLAEELLPELEAANDVWSQILVLLARAEIWDRRGRSALAEPHARRALDQAREADEAQIIAGGLAVNAAIASALGDGPRAAELLSELAAAPKSDTEFPRFLAGAVRTARRVNVDTARRLPDGVAERPGVSPNALVSSRALLAEASGELELAGEGFAEASEAWRAFGVPYEEAQALLGRGRCLVALGRTAEAADPLREGRAIFERLGATPALAETDGLLERAIAKTS